MFINVYIRNRNEKNYLYVQEECLRFGSGADVRFGGGNFLFFSDLQINNNWIDRLLPVSGPAGVFLCINDRRYVQI